MSVVVVIPARGGSRGVHRKALQLVDGEPLVVRAARLAGSLRLDGAAKPRVIVTTDSDEIESVCGLRGIEVHRRHPSLGADAVTLDAVLQNVAQHVPADHYLLLQPTVPLVNPLDLEDSFKQYYVALQCGVTGVHLVQPDPHVFWQNNRRLVPKENRQVLTHREDCVMREVGIRIYSRHHALHGGSEGVVELDLDSVSVDIDTYDDLNAAEAVLRRKWVEIQFVASPELGTGHLFRTLRLADALRRHHDVTVKCLDHRADWISQLVKDHGLYETPETGRQPDLLVLDALDLYDSRIISSLQHEVPVVVLESTSSTALKHATLVVNELLEQPVIPQAMNVLCGPRFAVLREEFAGLPPREVPERVKHILVTFGGSDPSDLASRVVRVLNERNQCFDWEYRWEIHVVRGPACQNLLPVGQHVQVVENAHMAEEMRAADLVITSKGRTQYEAAACGVPIVTLAANEREARHLSVSGSMFLGLHAAVSDNALDETLWRVISDQKLRQEMADRAYTAVDGRGVDRICWAIEGILRGL